MKFWLKHCIFGQFFAPPPDLQMYIKSEPPRVRDFLKPEKIDL